MRILLLTCALTFFAFISKVNAQRKYAYCRHVYCHALHIYDVDYNGYAPLLIKLVLDETQANPYRRLTCEPSNTKAKKHYSVGFDSLNHYLDGQSLTSQQGLQKNRMKMALIYFHGAIKADSSFCDAYDNLVNCYFLTKQYDSALSIIERQNNPSFHSKLAKGIIYYEINKDYVAAEKYFDMLSQKTPTSIYYYYLASSQIKLNKLNDAKVSLEKMDKTIEAWDDGLAMIKINLLVRGVVACREKTYDAAYEVLSRLKRSKGNNPIFCHYYSIAVLNKTDPSKRKSKKFQKRAVKLQYNPDIMI